MKYIVNIGEQEFNIDINDKGHVKIDGKLLDIDFSSLDGTPLFSLILNGQSYDVDIESDEELYRVMLKGQMYEVQVQDERTHRLAGVRGSVEVSGEVQLKAPMPGVVVKVAIEEGQTVQKGDLLVVLESMKMQNEFKSPKEGVIHHVRVTQGEKVEQNAVMVTIA